MSSDDLMSTGGRMDSPLSEIPGGGESDGSDDGAGPADAGAAKREAILTRWAQEEAARELERL